MGSPHLCLLPSLGVPYPGNWKLRRVGHYKLCIWHPVEEICSFSYQKPLTWDWSWLLKQLEYDGPSHQTCESVGTSWPHPCPLVASSNWKSFFRSILQPTCCSSILSLEEELSYPLASDPLSFLFPGLSHPWAFHLSWSYSSGPQQAGRLCVALWAWQEKRK